MIDIYSKIPAGINVNNDNKMSPINTLLVLSSQQHTYVFSSAS